jgi:hypothetical protein
MDWFYTLCVYRPTYVSEQHIHRDILYSIENLLIKIHPRDLYDWIMGLQDYQILLKKSPMHGRLAIVERFPIWQLSSEGTNAMPIFLQYRSNPLQAHAQECICNI